MQDVANSVVFVLSLFAGGTANAAYSADNADDRDNKYRCDRRNLNDDLQDACDNLDTVISAEGATAVSFSIICNYVCVSCDHSCVSMYCTSTYIYHLISLNVLSLSCSLTYIQFDLAICVVIEMCYIHTVVHNMFYVHEFYLQ